MIRKEKYNINYGDNSYKSPLHCNLYIVVFIAVFCSSCDISSVTKGGQEGDPQTSYLFRDYYPTVRPRTTQVSFVRYLGTTPPVNTKAGLYLVDFNTLHTEIIMEGLFGKPTWIDSNNVLVSHLNIGGKLISINVIDLSTTILTDFRINNPTFNPLDSTVVFEDSYNLNLLDLSNGGIHLLISGAHITPSWSPDGSMIAVGERVNFGHSRIISIITPNGEFLDRITEVKTSVFDSYPSWNTSGSCIIYLSESLSKSGRITSDIMIVDLNTRARTKIIQGYMPAFYQSYNGIIFSRYITERKKELRIYYFDLSTNEMMQLTF